MVKKVELYNLVFKLTPMYSLTSPSSMKTKSHVSPFGGILTHDFFIARADVLPLD